jgi:hypothetical protein
MAKSKEEDAIMSRIANLKAELQRQEGLLKQERMRIAGVAIGDIVECKGVRYQVADVQHSSYSVWVIGNPQRKDGTFGTAARRLYDDWKHVQSAPKTTETTK